MPLRGRLSVIVVHKDLGRVLPRRRGYISHKVVSDGTAFLGSQSQLGLLAQFTILAHSSRRIDRCLLFGGFEGASRRARRARGECDEERQWATGGIRYLKNERVTQRYFKSG